LVGWGLYNSHKARIKDESASAKSMRSAAVPAFAVIPLQRGAAIAGSIVF
jgi:hypothetical protein